MYIRVGSSNESDRRAALIEAHENNKHLLQEFASRTIRMRKRGSKKYTEYKIFGVWKKMDRPVEFYKELGYRLR